MAQVLQIEESSRTNICYIGAFTIAGSSKKLLQVIPVKLGAANLELQDLCTIDHTNAELQTINCMKSISLANKVELLFVGGIKHILVLKLTKSIYLQFFHKICGLFDGPILDLKFSKSYLISSGQSSKSVNALKFAEYFTIKQDKIDFSISEKPQTTELGPQSNQE